MNKALKDLTKLFQKRHGNDIYFMVARHPNFGDKDVCLILNGKNHEPAAKDFCLAVKCAKYKIEESCGFRGIKPYTYSVITFPAEAA